MYVLGCAVFLCLNPLTVAAIGLCGDIITFEDGVEYREPIDDCANPFGTAGSNPRLNVIFGATSLSENETYPFVNQTADWTYSGMYRNTETFTLYRQSGDDYYVELTGADTYTFTRAGTYVAVVYETDVPASGQADLLTVRMFTIDGAAIDQPVLLDGTAASCETLGIWDAAQQTCTLIDDVLIQNASTFISPAVIITAPGIALNGGGYTLGAAPGATAILVATTTDVTVHNTIFNEAGIGIKVVLGDSHTFTNNTYLDLSTAGVVLDRATGVSITNSTFSGNQTPFHFITSIDSTFVGNDVQGDENDDWRWQFTGRNTGSIYNNNFDLYLQSTTNTSGSSFTYSEDLPTGGNYYNFAAVNNGTCSDEDADLVCDHSLSQNFGTDEYPWAVPSGWEQYEPPAPRPSNVLFLPGIQASRLYLGDGVQVSDKLWEPGQNEDVRLLALNENGEGSRDIRTLDVIDEIAIPGLGQNVYKEFIQYMDGLVDDENIEEWRPFAYDWRYNVADIVENGTRYRDGTVQGTTKYPVQELQELANTSASGKVTIIAHSNGGLLAKAITDELGAESADLIDQIIFVGTPHLGTPKAIGTGLHGYDQQDSLGGIVIDDGVAREVIQNLPGAYSLLPSKQYFEEVSDPIVTFSVSSSTQTFTDYYEEVISDFDTYVDFLKGVENPSRSTVTVDQVNVPSVVNAGLLDAALNQHEETLDTWTTPDGVESHYIVGTGLPTMKAVEYREVLENTDCTVFSIFNFVCEKEKILKPYAQLTRYGDETVLSVSAEFSSDDANAYYLNLRAYNLLPLTDNIKHVNLTEFDEVQDLIGNLLLGSTTTLSYISSTQPTFVDSYNIEVIDSPVEIATTDSDGNTTGVVFEDGQWIQKEEIPGSQYFEFGGSKYLVTPSGISRSITMRGTDYGGYTLTRAQITSEGVQETQSVLINASTTPQMIATYTSSSTASTIVTDLDGNGSVDMETTVDGDVVDDAVTYEDLIEYITSLDIKQRYKKVLLRLSKRARNIHNQIEEKPHFVQYEQKLLNVIERVLWRFERRDVLSRTQVSAIKNIIDKLK